ncbi:RNA polymerase subunit sigma-70 [Paenibacillus filicis]|uniref:RNA polymerase sigma factor n=1 Tax=Paenibacillus gyeongsangnamensis TaxID=3388067 RepID=A0ABT4Q1Z0_9BACL|nr:RNA polymerase subunit sigma-70 [Paenibacillus filicis]MCZ8510854.1 RNA polymerase subunit sigma-70 [Paenibacillus filicis]
MNTDLITQAREGDGEAFRQLVEPYQRELHVHCYRILGSTHDADDVLQETLMAAWRGLGGFKERASIRTWLYRVATNRCLNALRSVKRRASRRLQADDLLASQLDLPEPSSVSEALWVEPYPDIMLDFSTDIQPGPEARYEMKEAISLAFMTAVQMLPPRQRGVLILRDVLGFQASEVAEVLDSSVESVNSALKRARAALQRRLPPSEEQPLPLPDSLERELIDQLTRAFEASNVDGIVALLAEDVMLTMPPEPMQYHGRELVARFLAVVTLQERRRYRTVTTRANGQPAFGLYMCEPDGSVFHALGLLVFTVAGSRISAITRFDNSMLSLFGLPKSLPR